MKLLEKSPGKRNAHQDRQRKASRRRDDAAQSRAVIKKAREIEAVEDKSAATDVLAWLAKMPPEPRKKKPGK